MAGKHILVVEDEAIIRMLMVDVLEDAGFAVLEADSGDAAVVALKNGHNIQAVISDVRMPGSLDGIGLAAWMRDNTPSVPIIIVSGFGDAPDWPTINPAIVRVVPKPCAANKIVEWVGELLADPR